MPAGPPQPHPTICDPWRPSEPLRPAARFLERLSDGEAALGASVAIIAAHPDDEVIGAGAQLPRLKNGSVLHVTDGAPRNMRDAIAAGFAIRRDYARRRRRELERALALAGLSPDRMVEIGVADQEASLNLAALALDLADHLARARPDIVITHPYEGGHPDHDATAFAVHAACRLLERRGTTPPAVLEMTSYHNCGGAMSVFEFLPNGGDLPTVTLSLTETQAALKRRMIDCFVTQKAILAPFPVAIERFRPAPTYDFTRPPHEGTLFFDLFDWGMTGERWRALAADALGALRIAGPPRC